MSPFEEFQKEEYGKIADAHFKTIESISAFFRHYLLLMALPLSLAAALATVSLKDATAVGVTDGARTVFAVVFIVVGLVGGLLMAYLVSLRCDALLYARTVNAIRKFFYDSAAEGALRKARMRVLPQNAHEPRYFEPLFFGPVVTVFSLLDAFYAYVGLCILADPAGPIFPGAALLNPPGYAVFIAAFLFLLHLLFYSLYTRWREDKYLKRVSIGIDIDGVLNKHREHFCSVLARVGGPKLDPDDITNLPVREAPALGVTRELEHKVFNQVEYWTDMPANVQAARIVTSLMDMGMKVHLVTNRPWPDLRRMDDNEARVQTLESWRAAARRELKAFPCLQRIFWTLACIWTNASPVISVLTRAWLRREGIACDSLTIERALSSSGVHPARARKNRVSITSSKRVRFFVEDDWHAAHRLAFFCDFVFLIRHPYNAMGARPDPFGKSVFVEQLPDNVFIVEDWPDILKLVTQLS